MRPACRDCVLKHISQAIVLLTESEKGYPIHRWLAVGHLAEAEDESVAEWLDISEAVRTARLLIMAGEGVDLMALLVLAEKRCQPAQS